MESGSQGPSQPPSFASATVSTPAQSAQYAQLQDPGMNDIYRTTQALLCDFLKKNEQRSERQPFLDFVAAEAEKLPDDKYDEFAMGRVCNGPRMKYVVSSPSIMLLLFRQRENSAYNLTRC